MPYTPPSHSPLSSRISSPAISRSQSYVNQPPGSPFTGPPALPRSHSYLSRHRRTPSASKGLQLQIDPLPKHVEDGNTITSGSLEPSSKDSQHIYHASELNQSSSDEDCTPSKSRGRGLNNLAELQAAIKVIDQRRESSPDESKPQSTSTRFAMDLVMPSAVEEHRHKALTALEHISTPPLTQEARKISHSRSSTESAIVQDTPEQSMDTPSGSDEESPSHSKPPMLRKKSGELVKPAIRPSSVRRRPSSMPGTPTYSKAVHFDNDLEHVRHFLQVDRPLAVSAGSSPVETYESEMEFPFGGDEPYRSRSPSFEWEIVLANFPSEAIDRRSQPVRVERVFLSADNKTLVGTVAAANISFHKLVVARFTLDYWKTTSEVVAEYNNDIRRKQVNDGYDRFNFNIKLADQANLESKTLFFCVRYNVNGQEFWDNNKSFNYQIDFRKKPKLQNGKNGMQGAGSRPLNSLPRSRPSPSSADRPHSMPASVDDFINSFDSNYNFQLQTPPGRLSGDPSPTTIRFKNRNIVPDSPAHRNNTTGQAFGNRYDFGASLSAAMSNGTEDRGGQKKGNAVSGAPQFFPGSVPSRVFAEPRDISSPVSPMTLPSEARSSLEGATKADDAGPEKPPLQSASYDELLARFCFFGSTKTSPVMGDEKPTKPQTEDVTSNDLPTKQTETVETERSEKFDASPFAGVIPNGGVKGSTATPPDRRSRSTSPSLNNSGSGPGFGSSNALTYPYHHGVHVGFGGHDFPTPTAIRG